MSDSWDSEDFVPVKVVGAVSDKWAGEDADDNVKDDWEQIEEAEKAEEKEKVKEKEKTGGAYQRPKKKPLAERLAEKEAKKKQPKEEEAIKKELSAAEKHAEKIRLRKIQEEADLRLAREAFGITDKKDPGTSIDEMFPSTEEDFVTFENALKTKITEFENNKFYATFLEKLFTDLTLGLQAEDCKKIGAAINSIYHEKEKQKKELERKKKKKNKITVNVERNDDFDFGLGEDYDTFDDDNDLI